MSGQKRPVIGISVGDLNGIGIELIIKTFSDGRLMDFCTPIVFGSSKALSYYRKLLPETIVNYTSIKEISKAIPKQLNLFSVWEEDVAIAPGQMNEIGGKYGVLSLQAAVKALKDKTIDGLVTAPLHKFTMQSSDFNFTGHTPYLQEAFQADDVLMLMIAENMRVGLLTEHIAIGEVAKHISKEKILKKINLLKTSLKKESVNFETCLEKTDSKTAVFFSGLITGEERNISSSLFFSPEILSKSLFTTSN